MRNKTKMMEVQEAFVEQCQENRMHERLQWVNKEVEVVSQAAISENVKRKGGGKRDENEP